MRRFVLRRATDPSGQSGTGIIAEGVEFSNGRVALQWLVAPETFEKHDSSLNLIRVHGHKGETIIDWVDEPLAAMLSRQRKKKRNARTR